MKRGNMTYCTNIIKQWPKLTLYGDLNMRPFRNIWMLEEIGLPYKHIVCKPWSRIAKSVHPLGKVPALLVENYSGGDSKEEEKFVLIESAAINTFLGDLARESSGDTHNNKMLVPPPSTPLRAKYDSLSMFIMTELDSQSLWIHRKHNSLSNVFGESPVAVQEAKRQFDNALDALVSEIANDEESYMLPTGFSAVDIIFANCCFWAQDIGWLDKYDDGSASGNTSDKQRDSEDKTTAPKPLNPKLAKYLQQCRSRPAFVRANELRKNQVYGKKDVHTSKL